MVGLFSEYYVDFVSIAADYFYSFLCACVQSNIPYNTQYLLLHYILVVHYIPFIHCIGTILLYIIHQKEEGIEIDRRCIS